MIDQNKQSAAAESRGVCHTDEECSRMYAELPTEIKVPAISMLAYELSKDAPTIRTAIEADPVGWVYPYHFGWGMGVRNLLRDKGFGEEYFGVHNLDDVYVFLVEDALRLNSTV